jgi:hypothetical protein
LYEGGLSQLKGSQTGIGFGIGRDGGSVGIGSSKPKGTNQSVLSKKAVPSSKKEPLQGGVLLSVGAMLINQAAPGNLTIVLLLIVGGALHVFANVRHNWLVFPGLFREWDASFLCLKCGVVSTKTPRQTPLE